MSKQFKIEDMQQSNGADDFRDFVLGFIFYKYLGKNMNGRITE